MKTTGTQMQAPHLDKDYDYYGTQSPTQLKETSLTAMSQQPRVRKGLGAMPVQDQTAQEVSFPEQQRQTQPRVVSPSNQQKQQVLDPPASIPQDGVKSSGLKEADDDNKQGESVQGDDALLDLDQLNELHEEAERMKALGNKHMAAQVRNER